MNDRKAFPWVNLWMLVFSVGGIWLIGGELLQGGFENAGGSIEYWLVLALLVGVGLAALWRMPMPFSEEAEGPEPTLSMLGRLYLHSWRKLLRMRWLVIIVGGIALIAVAEGVTQSIIFSPMWHSPRFAESPMLQNAGKPGTLSDYVQFRLPDDLEYAVRSSPSRFYPSLGVSWHLAIIPPLAIFALMIWLYLKLPGLASIPRYSRTVWILRSLLIPVGIVGLVVPVATFLHWASLVRQYTAAGSYPPPSPTYSLLMAAGWFSGLAYGLLVGPLLMGGFAGSLKRSYGGEQVDADTFVEDAVRYLKPFVGIALILLLATAPLEIPAWRSMIRGGNVPSWFSLYFTLTGLIAGLAYMFLMFVPYAVVVHDSGSLRAFRIGIRDWVRNVGILVPFVALGVTLVAPVSVVEKALHHMAGHSVWGSVTGLLFAVVGIVISAWLAVSVWELYRRVGSRPPEPEVIEG